MPNLLLNTLTPFVIISALALAPAHGQVDASTMPQNKFDPMIYSQAAPLTANSDGSGIRWKPQRDMFNPTETLYVRETAIYQSKTPQSLVGTGWETLAVGAMIIAFAHEEEMLDFVQKNDGKVVDKVENFARHFGSSKVGWSLYGGLAYAMIVGDNGMTRFFQLALKAGTITKLATDAIKLATRRPLPRDSDDPFSRSDSKKPSQLAFPSSHAATAFSLATVVAETYGEQNRYIPIFAYGIASLTAVSRLHDNSHWVSDVIAGALLGHFIAKNVMRAEDGNGGFEFTPYFGRRKFGIQVTYTERFEKSKPKACIGVENRTRGVEECINAHLNP